MNLRIIPILSSPPLTRTNFTISELHTKIIRDFNGDKLLKFPMDTLLDMICDDLWSEMIKYLEYHIAIGDYSESYPGYRLMRKEDFNKKKIGNYYAKNKGIPYLFDYGKNIHEELLISGYKIMDIQHYEKACPVHSVGYKDSKNLQLYACGNHLNHSDGWKLIYLKATNFLFTPKQKFDLS